MTITKNKLITQSLVSGVEWLQNCPPSWKENAYKDLVSMLSRDYSKPMPEPVRIGIEFENVVYSVLNGQLKPQKELSPKFQQVLDRCHGGIFQKKSKSFIKIKNVSYCLYGKIDVYFPKEIIDIKTTKDFKGPQKYLDSIQHRVYCHNEKIPKFTYLVAELNEKKKISKLREVNIEIDDFEKNEIIFMERIENVLSFIYSDKELKELYNTKFCIF